MGTIKKHMNMNISRQNTNELVDTTTITSSKINNSFNSINNIINQRRNVYQSTPTSSKNIINTNNRKNEFSLIKNNSAYLTTRRCLNNSNNNNNKKSQLNINSNSKNNLNNELETNHTTTTNTTSTNNKNINSYINKLSLAINNKQIHKIEQQNKNTTTTNFNSNNQHSNSFSFEKTKLENRNIRNPIVSVLNSSNSINTTTNNRNKLLSSNNNSSLKPFNEIVAKCEKENTSSCSNLKTKKNSIKELKISNITNIQASIERYEEKNQEEEEEQEIVGEEEEEEEIEELDTPPPVIYLNSSLNTNFSLNQHRFNTTTTTKQIYNNKNNNDDKLLKENKNENFNFKQTTTTTTKNILSQNKLAHKKLDRPASIVSLNNSTPNTTTNDNNDSVESLSQLTFNICNTNNTNSTSKKNKKIISTTNMLSSASNIINASATSFRLTQSQKDKNSKAYTLKSNKSIASSSSSSQNLIASLNQNQINKFIAATAAAQQQTNPLPSHASHSMSHKSCDKKATSYKVPSSVTSKLGKTTANYEYENSLVEKMASFIDELKDFIDDRLIDTTSQLELANQRISGLYFNLNYLTSELISLKKQNEELKKELIYKNNTARSILQEQQYLDTYSEYTKKMHSKTSDRYMDSSCMKIPDSSSNLETTMNNSSSHKTSSPETTSASSTSTSTSLIISQTPLDNLYMKKSSSPPQAYRMDSTPKSSKEFKSGKHFELLNDLELKRREKRTAAANAAKINQSSSSSINSINFYDNMSIVNRFEINWPTRSTTDQNNYSHRTSSPSQLDLNNLIQTHQYASTDFDNDDLYGSPSGNEKNYELLMTQTATQPAQQQNQSSSINPNTSETLHFETNTPSNKLSSTSNNLDESSCNLNEKELSNDLVLNHQKGNLVHHLHASIGPYNNLISDFDSNYIWDYENNSLVNKYNEKSENNIKFQN